VQRRFELEVRDSINLLDLGSLKIFDLLGFGERAHSFLRKFWPSSLEPRKQGNREGSFPSNPRSYHVSLGSKTRLELGQVPQHDFEFLMDGSSWAESKFVEVIVVHFIEVLLHFDSRILD